MTTRPYELLVCFAPNGSIRGASVRYITTVNGRDYEGDPIPLEGVEDPAFAAFTEQFGAAAITERDTARAELATMTEERNSLASSLAEMTTARDDARSHVALLQASNDKLRDDLHAKSADLTAALQTIVEADAARESAEARASTAEARVAELEPQLQAAQQRISALQSQVPWDVRILDASAFLARINQAELLDLTTSDDQQKHQIALMLSAYRANDWPVMLDSPEMQQAIGYLTQVGMLNESRAAELLRDSTRDEAYKAGE